MPRAEKVREIVREKYGEIAREAGGAGCCGPADSDPGCGCGCGPDAFHEAYDHLAGYSPDADLGLGCGVPTESAGIREGDTVLDLGSGAGNDAFVARAIVGAGGRVIGVDMTPEMIARARANAAKLGHANVEFRLGEIEHLPVADGSVDVVISNCVLNLVPDKKRAFAEIHRVMKPAGRFCISDIVVEGTLPEALRRDAEMIAGCVAGASRREDYLRLMEEAGFAGIEIAASREIDLPDELLRPSLDPDALRSFRESGSSIRSVTVVGRK